MPQTQHKVFCREIVTGQTTRYNKITHPAPVLADDDGHYEKGIPRDYRALTTGQHSGNFNISILNHTYAMPNAVVWDNRKGEMWTQGVLLGCGPADDGKLFWEQWPLTNKTDISFTALVGADVLGGDGDCAADFFDTVEAGWAHDAGNGEYDCDGSQGVYALLTEHSSVVIGTVYKTIFTVKNRDGVGAGSVKLKCGSTSGSTYRSADGTYTEFITASGNTAFYVQADGDFIGSVDDITVEPVTGGEILSGAAEFDTGACCVGRIVLPSGSTDNDRNYTVTITTAAKLTVSETSIIDEAAGATITIATVGDLIWDFLDQANSGSGLGGYTDWRVANIVELESLLDFGQDQPLINQTVFPSTPSDWQWTNTTRKANTTQAFSPSFGNTGRVMNVSKQTNKYYCRLVRGGA